MKLFQVSSAYRNLILFMQWSIHSLLIVLLLDCSSNHKTEASWPIAKFGNTPSIDGIFTDGEWDDANVVQVNPNQKFWVKHDYTNLYFAFAHDGGNLYLSKHTTIRILHASAQLGSAEYKEFDNLMYSLEKPFEWKLNGLQNETAKKLTKSIADYLAENGWVASTGSLGNFAQVEWAVSFESLGISDPSKRFMETPGLFIFSSRMRLSPEEKEAFMALPNEERKNRYPPLYWPNIPVPNDSLNNGLCPETIQIDPTSWNKILIDFKSRAYSKQ